MSAAYPEPRIRLARPDVGDEEIEAVTRVLRTSVLTAGPETAAFEREFAAYHGADHGVAFANGTVALVAMLVAFGVGPGDEVIVPSLTFVSSATAIVHAGATPVFADVDPDTFNVDPADVARRLGPKVKAVIAVHYGGQAADLAELADLAAAAGVVLVEDAAEAHGARYRERHVGTWGAAGMFSFTPTKNITTGEGGMVTTGDGDLARRLRLLRNHGQTSLYEHSVLGWNWRITEMQAAMGRCQVAKLDAILARKRYLAAQMDASLDGVAGLRTPVVRPDRDHVYMLYTVKAATGRDQILDELRAGGIEARVYFPPVHRQPIFAGVAADLPVTDDLAGRILSLPVHSRLSVIEADEVAAALAAAATAAAAGSAPAGRD
ncbi:MAG TPA: DegT/DnrJ/EryC1/StrS family aminotransferase [Acidimicrobiales bacterium]|nr:DegT/DnrJ/EryC1/StrS family aminotransferase [Acidimicrobiales bacterium]